MSYNERLLLALDSIESDHVVVVNSSYSVDFKVDFNQVNKLLHQNADDLSISAGLHLWKTKALINKLFNPVSAD
jgi:hypothetical protein